MMKNSHYRDPLTGEIIADRRSRAGRRSSPSILAFLSSRHRRRKSKGRRSTDEGAYVDIYDARSWSIAIAVLILSFIDAVLTGMHLSRGTAEELNPIMNAVIIHAGMPAFFGAKIILTALPVAVILIHKEWVLGRYAALVCLSVYVLLTLYHLYLLLGLANLHALL
jgi:hypothetical protein